MAWVLVLVSVPAGVKEPPAGRQGLAIGYPEATPRLSMA